MKIVIAGAGETGNYLSQIFLKQNHDLIVIERNEKVVQHAQEHLDAQIIQGDASNVMILEPLIDETTDLFVALTDNDDANILSTLIARKFGAKRAIVRVSETSNLIHPLLTDDPKVSTLNGEMAVAKDLMRLIGNPSADEIEFFASGKAEMVKFQVGPECRIISQKFKDISVPPAWLFIAIVRKGEFSVVSGDSHLEAGDQVWMVGDPGKTKAVEQLLDLHPHTVKRVILIGYNDISSMLAKSLVAKKIEVRLIEENKSLAEQASAELNQTLILNGDPTSDDILSQAGIEQADVLLALTHDDENNVLISLLAKEKKVEKVITLSQKPQYKPLIEKIGVDSVVNKRSALVDEIIRSMHHEDLSGINILEGGQGQTMEFVIKNVTKIVNIPLSKIKLPKQTIIGAIVRNDNLIIPRGSDSLHQGDHVVVFAKRSAIDEVKKIFT